MQRSEPRVPRVMRVIAVLGLVFILAGPLISAGAAANRSTFPRFPPVLPSPGMAVGQVGGGTTSSAPTAPIYYLMNSTVTGLYVNVSTNTTIANVTGQVGGENVTYTTPVVGNASNLSVGEQLGTLVSNNSSLAPQGPGPNGQHYYSGMIWNGLPVFGGVSSVQVTVMMPNDIPIWNPSHPDEFYNSMISVFDTAGSYDQLGADSFQSGYGPYGTDNWGLTWAHLANCGNSVTNGVDWKADVMQLNPGIQYTFRMSISSGIVTYTVYQLYFAGSYAIWSLSYRTGGTAFSVNANIVCIQNNGVPVGRTDYTDYEENHLTNQQNVPNWDFWYSNTLEGGASAHTWTKFYAGTTPPGIDNNLYGSGPSLVNLNEYFTMNLSSYSVTAPAGGSTTIGGAIFDQQTTNCPVSSSTCAISSMSAYLLPSGWSVGFSPSTGNPPFSFTVTITVPSSASCNPPFYQVGLKAYSSAITQFTTVRVSVLVYGCSTGYGGGCVLAGTQIDTPSGLAAVQSLEAGQTIYGYNLTTHDLVTETIHNLTSSSATAILNIDHGLLYTTLLDQPIWVVNATAFGWIRDPINLTAGDLMWNPLNSTWVPVDNLSVVSGSYTVYDLVPNGGLADFTANGMLIGMKSGGGGDD